MNGAGTSGLDPIGFVLDDLAARGALVERSELGASICAPAEVAGALAIPEVAELAVTPAPGALFAGLGSPLLDRLLREACADVAVARVRWTVEPPRATHAEAIARHVVFRNGVADVIGVGVEAATYVVGAFAWTADADDRYQGLITVVLDAARGGEPDRGAAMELERALATADDVAAEHAPAQVETSFAADRLARRASATVALGLAGITAAVDRRAARERTRIDEYFAALLAEARRPRRKVSREAIEARLRALEGEREAKLRALGDRYSLRVAIAPAALAIVAVRVAAVRVRARRRKGERVVDLRVPAFARQPDTLLCVACGGTTRAPLLCDDALHILCETCVPDSTGRPRCPACR
jgi:hypothetical protein